MVAAAFIGMTLALPTSAETRPPASTAFYVHDVGVILLGVAAQEEATLHVLNPCPGDLDLRLELRELLSGQNLQHEPGEITTHHVASGEGVEVALRFGPPSGNHARRYGLLKASMAPPGPCTAPGNEYRTPAAIAISDTGENARTSIRDPFIVPILPQLEATGANASSLVSTGPTDTAIVSLYNACESGLAVWQADFGSREPSTGTLEPAELVELVLPTSVPEERRAEWIQIISLTPDPQCPGGGLLAVVQVVDDGGETKVLLRHPQAAYLNAPHL
jgi:hypothetical protein